MSDAQAIYDELDAASRALECYQMTNHYAYLKWSAEDRLAFDRGKHDAQARWHRAYAAKRELKRDIANIAKVKRIQKKARGETRKKTPIRSRGFDKTKTKKLGTGRVVERKR